MEEELKNFIDFIKTVNNQFTKVLKLSREIVKLYEDPILNAYKLSTLAKRLKTATEKIKFDSSIFTETVSMLEKDTDRLKEEFRFEFGGTLEKELASRGFELRGQLPILYTKYYTIKVDFQLGKAILLFGPETLRSNVPLKPRELADTLKDVDKEMEKELFSKEEFLKKLYESWQRIGESKPLIIKVLNELIFLIQPPKFLADPSRKNFIEYTRAKFGYDLYKLDKDEIKEIDGHRLSLVTATFDATSKKGTYIWVPINEKGEGVNYSYLTFSK
jgi:hypothetical protein